MLPVVLSQCPINPRQLKQLLPFVLVLPLFNGNKEPFDHQTGFFQLIVAICCDEDMKVVFVVWVVCSFASVFHRALSSDRNFGTCFLLHLLLGHSSRTNNQTFEKEKKRKEREGKKLSDTEKEKKRKKTEK